MTAAPRHWFRLDEGTLQTLARGNSGQRSACGALLERAGGRIWSALGGKDRKQAKRCTHSAVLGVNRAGPSTESIPPGVENRPRWPWLGHSAPDHRQGGPANAALGTRVHAPSDRMLELRAYEDGLLAGAAAWQRNETIGAYQRVGLDAYTRGFRAGYFVDRNHAAGKDVFATAEQE